MSRNYRPGEHSFLIDISLSTVCTLFFLLFLLFFFDTLSSGALSSRAFRVRFGYGVKENSGFVSLLGVKYKEEDDNWSNVTLCFVWLSESQAERGVVNWTSLLVSTLSMKCFRLNESSDSTFSLLTLTFFVGVIIIGCCVEDIFFLRPSFLKLYGYVVISGQDKDI